MVGYYPTEDVEYVSRYVAEAEEVLLEKILREEAAEKILVLEDFKETVRRASAISEADIDKEARVLAASHSSGVIGSLKVFPTALRRISFVDLILGLFTIGIIYGFRFITRKIPSTLVALLLVTIVAYFFIDEYRNIGDIPSGFPAIQWGIFSDFRLGQLTPYIVSAISLAVLGAIDSLLTSVVADNMTKTKHKPNKELIGQGIGNTIAALFGGIPGAGATIRTVVNIDSGGKTRLSGMLSGLMLLFILLALGPLASKIPAAVLAGILVTVGFGVMDYKGLRHIRSLPISEVLVMLAVLILTVFVGLIEAVLVGMILSSLLFMKIISDVVEKRTNTAPLRTFSREIPWMDEEAFFKKYGDKVYIKHLDGPLFFGFASRFQEMVKALPDIKTVVMRMEKVPYVDQSGLYAMEDAITDLHKQGINVVFTGLYGQPKDIFAVFNIVPGLVKIERCFDTWEECAVWLETHVDEDLTSEI
jgi:SulP family sulfate permease